MGRPKTDPLARFWANVMITPGCWVWTGNTFRQGYAKFYTGELLPSGAPRMVSGHRYSYELHHGPVPDGLVVDHRLVAFGCPRHCVNPDHLRTITAKQNSENMGGLAGNNTSGARGVVWHKTNKRWMVAARHHGKRHYGGYFDDLSEANRAAIALRLSLHTHNELDRKQVA